MPNSLLDTIPSSDLGESLDTRGHHAHLGKEPQDSEVEQNSGGTRSAPVSANSLGQSHIKNNINRVVLFEYHRAFVPFC